MLYFKKDYREDTWISTQFSVIFISFFKLTLLLYFYTSSTASKVDEINLLLKTIHMYIKLDNN